MKIKKTILLITLLFLLIGMASASEVSENTTSKVAKDTNDAPNMDVQSSEQTVEK